MNFWFQQASKIPNADMYIKAGQHQSILTKPPGALGHLETLAKQFAAWQSRLKPELNHIEVAIFAGDHGICQQGVSAFPQEVTVQMIANFLDGGAAINVLCRQFGAQLHIINMGTAYSLPEKYRYHKQLTQMNIAAGTADFCLQPALTDEQLSLALGFGQSYINQLKEVDIFIGGEMGIGNTTSAAAIYAALLSLSPEQVSGPGTGLDENGVMRKQAVIAQALERHKSDLVDPYQTLKCLGGFEIAGLVGAYIACAQRGIPILVDGFICTAAALVAVHLNSGVGHWLLFSHQSAEPAHHLALQWFSAKPLIQLDMRLGEGSGAAVSIPIIQAALNLHNQMATFHQAGVSHRES